MKFKNVLLLLLFNLLFFSLTGMPTDPYEYKKDGKYFKETDIFQFRLDIPYDILDDLKCIFQRDCENEVDIAGLGSLEDLKIAGFSFIPIMNVTKTTPSTIEFSTVGLRAVLTLWEPFDCDKEQPRKVVLYPFSTIREATNTYDQVLSDFQRERTVDFLFSETNQSEIDLDKEEEISFKNSREFDLVFLGIGDFEDLSLSTRYFPNFERLDEFGNIKEGITIERCVNTIKSMENNIPKHTNFRSIIFRPFPNPEKLQPYPSEMAVAINKGHECPPWWKSKNGNDNETTISGYICQEEGDRNAAGEKITTLKNCNYTLLGISLLLIVYCILVFFKKIEPIVKPIESISGQKKSDTPDKE